MCVAQERCSLPSSGFVRSYPAARVAAGSLLAGTVAGEFAVFKLDTRVYRACVPVSANGVLAVALGRDGAVFAGCGDGKLKKFEGADTRWVSTAEVSLRGRVGAVSVSADGSFLLAGTSDGRIFRASTADLDAREVETSHVAPVRCLSFGSERSDLFVTGSDDGTVRVWDLSDYRVTVTGGGRSKVTAVFFDDLAGGLLAGGDDGYVRSYDEAAGRESWYIAAHRGAVTALMGTEAAVVSGGVDGKVAVWLRRSRELLLQFTEHIKPVVAIVADLVAPHLIHSAGSDRCVFTYDLKEERRIVGHQMSKTGVGQFTAMSQRKDNEQELVTGGTDGKLLFWDCDVLDAPVMAMQDPSQSRVNSLRVSPSGRFIVVCSDDHHVKVFDVQRQTLLAAKLGHSSRVCDVAWSPDERQVVSVGEDSCISVWNFFGSME